jgi:hypothetical protein
MRATCPVRLILHDLIILIQFNLPEYAQRHEKRLRRHTNVEALQLLDNGDLARRLHRTKPFELVSGLYWTIVHMKAVN